MRDTLQYNTPVEVYLVQHTSAPTLDRNRAVLSWLLWPFHVCKLVVGLRACASCHASCGVLPWHVTLGCLLPLEHSGPAAL